MGGFPEWIWESQGNSDGLERQRGIDGEVAHLFQEYKDNPSSSVMLVVEKLSWEFQQFSIPEKCPAPTHMDQTDLQPSTCRLSSSRWDTESDSSSVWGMKYCSWAHGYKDETGGQAG